MCHSSVAYVFHEMIIISNLWFCNTSTTLAMYYTFKFAVTNIVTYEYNHFFFSFQARRINKSRGVAEEFHHLQSLLCFCTRQFLIKSIKDEGKSFRSILHFLKLTNTVKSHMLKTVWVFVKTYYYIMALPTVLQHFFSQKHDIWVKFWLKFM